MAHSDWRKNSIAQKGRFGKYKKITFTQEMFTTERKKPGPHSYKTDNKNAQYIKGNKK